MSAPNATTVRELDPSRESALATLDLPPLATLDLPPLEAEALAARVTASLPLGVSVRETVAAPPELPDGHATVQLPAYRTRPGPATEDTRPAVVLQGVLGQGGMGVVHLAHQASLGRDVAVKRVRDDAARDDAPEHLLREALITGALAHPNIVPVYDLAMAEDRQPMLVMKRIEGQPWEQALADTPLAERAGPWLERQLRVLMDVCDAIHFAHSRGVIHRDLKPENVMLGHFGEVLVVDWGVAVAIDEALRGRFPMAVDSRHIAGTPAYMAPEQVTGDGRLLGAHTDIYLLGAVLFEVLTGDPPHDAETAHASLFKAYTAAEPSLPEQYPPPLTAICARAMAREPGERYPDVGALKADLAAFLEHRTSIEITDRALRDARTLHATPPADALDGASLVDPLGVHKLFTRCKFGFQQALDIWPENSRAAEGLQDILRLMIGRAIDGREFGTAALLYEELPRPEPALKTRLREAREADAAHQAGLRKLGELGKKHDLRVGRVARRWFTVALAVLWPGLSLLAHFAHQRGTLDGTRQVIEAGAFMVGILLYAAVRRRFVAAGSLNHRMFYMVMLTLMAVFALRLYAAVGKLAPWHAQPAELLLFFLGQGAMGALTLRRLAFPALLYAIGSAFCAVLPQQAFLISAITHISSMGLALWLLDRSSITRGTHPKSPGAQASPPS